jgi:hypothetical protein
MLPEDYMDDKTYKQVHWNNCQQDEFAEDILIALSIGVWLVLGGWVAWKLLLTAYVWLLG